MNLFFSIVLPAYNTPPDILRRAMSSVLSQTYPYFELIIVDDGSEPSLESIVKEYNDERIVFIRHPKNRGAGAAHNTGIKASKYDWIAFICHDDEWLPNKLEVCVSYIEENYPQYKFFFHLPIVISDEDEIKDIPFINPVPKTGNHYLNYLQEFDLIIQTSCIIVNKQCFDDYGYYDETGVIIDCDIYLRFSKYIDFYCINEYLCKYYITPLGISNKNTIFNNQNAGNDVIKSFFKWKDGIKKDRRARKLWAIRINAIAKYLYDKNEKKMVLKLYWESIKLYPFWRGNYIDIIKHLPKIIKLMFVSK